MASRFLNKVVLVTGASSGIGAATAAQLALEGAHLVITGRNKENLAAVANKCYSECWNRPKVVVGDLTNENDVHQIVDSTISQLGRLDVLINNAGILEEGSIESTSTGQFDRIMNTNVRAMYQLTMLAVPHLIESRGSIVNVSSVNGLRPFGNVLAYNISKSAVNQFTQSVAMELAGKHVRVNAVNPGVIITELQKRGGMSQEAYKKVPIPRAWFVYERMFSTDRSQLNSNFLARSKETHPLGRPGFAQEVAEAICFLASDKASFITGVTLPVDGGRHALSPR